MNARALVPTNMHLSALLAVLVAGFSVVLGGDFLSLSTFQSIAYQLPELGLLALAMSLTLLSGGLNLAIVAIADVAGLTIAALVTHPAVAAWGGGGEILAVAAGLATATTAGAVIGWLIGYRRVSPILATLGAMTLLNGLALALTRGTVISGFPSALLFLGNGALLGIPVPLVILGLAALALEAVLQATPFGVAMRMIGSNEAATRFSGVDTRAVLFGVYTLSGLLSGLAAVVMVARFNSAKAGYGESYLLVTILAAVLGGIGPDGGVGRLSGLMIALVVLQVISSGMNLLGVSPYLTLASWGAVLLAALGLPILQAKFARGRGVRR